MDLIKINQIDYYVNKLKNYNNILTFQEPLLPLKDYYYLGCTGKILKLSECNPLFLSAARMKQENIWITFIFSDKIFPSEQLERRAAYFEISEQIIIVDCIESYLSVCLDIIEMPGSALGNYYLTKAKNIVPVEEQSVYESLKGNIKQTFYGERH